MSRARSAARTISRRCMETSGHGRLSSILLLSLAVLFLPGVGRAQQDRHWTEEWTISRATSQDDIQRLIDVSSVSGGQGFNWLCNSDSDIGSGACRTQWEWM